MKKLINSPNSVVDDALRGLAATRPDLRVDSEHRVVFRADEPRRGKVAVVSGGGAGHEPLHSGFVGEGMLDAAVVGEMFTSPNPTQILTAIQAVDADAGVLCIVKNYTGDVLNFEMATELAQAEGIDVRTVIVADDVAVEDSTFTAGRRGVAGTVFVEKIVGAAADAGVPLDELVVLAERVCANVRSMGVALTSCVTPGAGQPTFDLPEDEIEVGIGIHGEPGRRREPLVEASSIARTLIEPILHDLDFAGHRAALLVNGLGATPLIELQLMTGEVLPLLRKADVQVARCGIGNFVTSLNMAGCFITLLRADDEMLRWLDAPSPLEGLAKVLP
ncbi:dihydroxyacetone kinase subunit DhaK [uncultured Tessaracoccus sp.]|uniref:dihydroxyacetone kinase subunit DhaK n=1 Tax=uncultured Tessaracoccus sp. TaxID=905023 RepID=UPI00260A27B7|nr:dihydroxyacetone kinase subunit DhaK [uncultured Tessaracoccus sp.]